VPLKKYYIPNLSGRWEGRYVRLSKGSDRMEHDYVLEIHQTYSTIHCITYQQTGSSCSFTADIYESNDEAQYYLCFAWSGKPNQRTEKDGTLRWSGEFDGLTKLQLHPRVGDKTANMEGIYFTSRLTNGRVSVNFVSREHLGRYE
jgi:hypothetical protein